MVEYLGPMYIAIRSGTHRMYITAESHAQGFEMLISLEKLARIEHGNVNPMVVLTLDSGLHENLR